MVQGCSAEQGGVRFEGGIGCIGDACNGEGDRSEKLGDGSAVGMKHVRRGGREQGTDEMGAVGSIGNETTRGGRVCGVVGVKRLGGVEGL